MVTLNNVPATTVTSAKIDPAIPPLETEYRALYAFLFHDALKSKRCEASIRNQCEIIADRVAAAPVNAAKLREAGIRMVQTILDGYFSTPPLKDDPLHASGQTRLDILAQERTDETLPLDKAVRQIYANMRRFAQMTVDRAVARGLAPQREELSR